MAINLYMRYIEVANCGGDDHMEDIIRDSLNFLTILESKYQHVIVLSWGAYGFRIDNH